MTKKKFWVYSTSSRDLLAAGKNRRRWLVFQMKVVSLLTVLPSRFGFAPFQLPIRKARGSPRRSKQKYFAKSAALRPVKDCVS